MSAPAGARTVRAHNLGLVLRQVAAVAPVSRARVAELTGLTRGTVSSLVDELLGGGLLEELAADRSAPGRPANPLRLSTSGPVGLGLQVDVDHVGACVLDLDGTVLEQRVLAVDAAGLGPAATLARVAGLAAEVLGPVGRPVLGAGVAVPGLVDPDGRVRRAPNLPGWSGVDVPAALGAVSGAGAVRAANEADLAALAELWFGGHPEVVDFLHVSGEIGVGAGIVLGGGLFRGAAGRAGELGHVVVDPAGGPCSCGGRGCLELVAGQRAVLAAAGVDTVAALVVAAEAGAAQALAALGAAGGALAVAVAGAVNLLDVPAVVLGGVHARWGEWLVPPVEAELARRGLGCTVRLSGLGVDAAVRGAAGSVVRGVLDDPAVHLGLAAATGRGAV